jgi:AcrR family transcriptional regulator
MSELIMPRATPKPRTSASADETRRKIVEAALETLKAEGIAGTSARAIARTGGFNQALIFYHFGSVNDVLLAGVERLSNDRLARYESKLEGVESLPDLVAVATELHREDSQSGHITVLSQMLAAAASAPEIGPELRRKFDPWVNLVEETVRRVLSGTPMESMVPVEDIAFAITGMFMGIELLANLDEDRLREESLFATIGMMAGLFDLFMGLMPIQAPTAP